MNVRDLIMQLEEFDPDDTVILAKDDDYNNYNELNMVSDGVFNEEENEFFDIKTDAKNNIKYDENDIKLIKNSVNCVCLWPK